MAVPIPKIHSYWISPKQTTPPVSPLGPHRSLLKMGRARWATLEACGLSVSRMETGRQMASQLGCPLHHTGNLSSGSFTWCLVCLDHRWRVAFQFQIDSPTLLPVCEPLRKIYLERISLFKSLFVPLYVGVDDLEKNPICRKCWWGRQTTFHLILNFSYLYCITLFSPLLAAVYAVLLWSLFSP